MQINGHDYNFGKLNARKQFHIMRRLTPVLSELTPLIKMFNQKRDDESNTGLQLIEHIAKTLGGLKDDDADFILDGLLDSITRDNGNGLGFSSVRVNGVTMFADIDMPTELTLAYHAIKANFTDFIPAIRSALSKAPTAPSVL